ncbi:MAG: hypothetical protein AB3N11_07680 [Arenibacterium sp.]
MAHVLIGFAEALPAPEVVFSLLSAGHQVSAFSRVSDLPLKSLPLAKLHVIPAPEDDVQASVDAVAAIMQASDAPDFLLPMDDLGLWVANQLEMPGRIAGATGRQADAALDKATQVAAAKVAGLEVPSTWLASDLARAAPEPPLPLIAKPALAVRVQDNCLGKDDAAYLSNRTDVRRYAEEITASTPPILVQPLIKGVGEGVFGFATENGIVAWSGHRRLRMMNPHGSGSSACISFAPERQLREKVAAFLAELGWRGAFMVELLRDESGTPWFMELNGRMWGSMALARRQGFEYPAWNVALAEDASFAPAEQVTSSGTLEQRHLGREILHLLFTLRGPKSEFHKQDWPRLRKSLPAVLRPARGARFYNYDPAFPRYFLKDAFWTVKKALRR